jgi:hypothetical protein
MKLLRFETSKAFGEGFGITVTQAETDASAGVGEEGAVHVFVMKLLEFLVGEDESEAEFAGTGEKFGHAGGDVAAEFVTVEPEVAAGGFGLRLAAEGKLVEFGDKKRAQE